MLAYQKDYGGLSMPQRRLTNMGTTGQRLYGWVVLVVFGIFLSVTLLAANMLQLLSVVLFPFSTKAFRFANRYAADFWWGMCVVSAKLCYGTRLELSGDAVPEKESVIVVPNHQDMADITYLMFLARSKHRLGDLKWFVKDILKYVPGMGWGMLFLGCVFVKRNWSRDRATIERTFSNLNNSGMPFWLMIFAEGTRVTVDKVVQSRDYAVSRNMAPLDHVLIPRTNGFVASVQALREGHLDAVYDVTIGYPQGVPTLVQYIRGGSRVAHFHVRRFPIEELPTTNEGLDRWLVERFGEKDKLLDAFYRNGLFG
jgi:1-acyl-sn-glycerol-3-phosphate acyltransferase